MSPDSALIAAAIGFAFFAFFFAVVLYVITSFFLMKIFDKAGVQGRWRAWVPVYNYMVFTKLGDLSPWLILILVGASVVLSQVAVLGGLVTLASYLLLGVASWRVGLKLQKEAVWVILAILVMPVWLGINAFDKSRWNVAIPPAPWAGNAFLSDRTVWAGIPAQGPVGGYAAAPGYPPAGYQSPAPPAGYQPPAPPAGYQPPAPPAGYQPPVAPPAAYEPPVAPAPAEPPVAPAEPPATEPPAAEPPATEPKP